MRDIIDVVDTAGVETEDVNCDCPLLSPPFMIDTSSNIK